MKSFFKSIVAVVLEFLARAVLRKYKPKIVAVTGSVGKTTTKDAIYTVLAENGRFVRKSEKSFNSEIGLPLTILGCANAWSNPFHWLVNFLKGLFLIIFRWTYPNILMLEIGADRPGDIERVTKWLKPNIAVLTRMGKVPVHVEYFSSPEAVRREKSFLAAAALSEKEGGKVVLNIDDPEDAEFFKQYTDATILTYGFSEKADVRAGEKKIEYENSNLPNSRPIGISFILSAGGDHARVKVHGVLGRQPIYACLAAAAVGKAMKIELKDIAKALSRHKTPPGRMRILKGRGGSILLDDTYNSSPVAAEEALETLREFSGTNRKIAVLGDMLELGDFYAAEHRALGDKLAISGAVDLLITVGLRAKLIAESASVAGLSPEKIFSFEDSFVAGEFLKREVRAGDIVLLKASQGIRLEKAVREILEKPGDARKLLVRQESEWLNR